MKWNDVGGWLKDNAGTGTALIGSLLTGNVPGALAAGVSLVSSATGSTDPAQALLSLQSDPSTMVKLKELYYQNEDSVRKHLETMTRLELEDKQAEHHDTQETVRAGDRAEDRFVKYTRPTHASLSLIAAIVYAFNAETPDMYVLGLLLTLPFTYAGLRQIGKGFDSKLAMESLKNVKGVK